MPTPALAYSRCSPGWARSRKPVRRWRRGASMPAARTGGAAHQSAAHLVAATAGVGIERAGTAVEVGKRLRDQPLADDAFRRGELSLDQAAPITEAVGSGARGGSRPRRGRVTRDAAKPAASGRGPSGSRPSATGKQRYARQRSLRTFRHGTDRDGMVYGHFRLPPDSGAAVVNTIEDEADRCYRATDRDRRHRDSHEQHAADALVAVVMGKAASPGGAELVVHVSHDALLRGSVEGDELCTVEGVGDVPVDVARRVLDDAFLKGVVVDGTEVQRVRHFGRRASAAVRTALRVQAVLGGGRVQCAASGCDRRAGIEWDHIEPHARGGPTEIANFQPLCRYHHREKTAGRLVVPP